MLGKLKHLDWLIALVVLCVAVIPVSAQQGQEAWFRTGTGLGVEKIRLAVADFGPRADNAKLIPPNLRKSSR